MKAERRHELQQNSLAKVLSDLPLYIRFHSNKILIGIIFICLLILLIRYRANAARQQREMIQSSLIAAHNGVEQLQYLDEATRDDSARSENRKKVTREVQSAVDAILDGSSDAEPTVKAEALLARGDLNWTLANLAPLAGAATQPSLALPQSPTQYLEASESAYLEVLRDYQDNTFAKSAALLGLAAIEENRGGWDKAADYYKKIQSDDHVAETYKIFADGRLRSIPQLKQPVFLGSFSTTQPSSQPSSQPTPSLEPATAPTTRP